MSRPKIVSCYNECGTTTAEGGVGRIAGWAALAAGVGDGALCPQQGPYRQAQEA